MTHALTRYNGLDASAILRYLRMTHALTRYNGLDTSAALRYLSVTHSAGFDTSG
jgi:hypothetical protein